MSGCGRVPYKGTCCHNLIAGYLNPGIVILSQFPEKIVGANGMIPSKEKSGSGKEGGNLGIQGFSGLTKQKGSSSKKFPETA